MQEQGNQPGSTGPGAHAAHGPLTPKLKATLDFLRSYIGERGYAPTAQEIADRFSIARNAAVTRLNGLHNRGYVTLYPSTPRGIALVE